MDFSGDRGNVSPDIRIFRLDPAGIGYHAAAGLRQILEENAAENSIDLQGAPGPRSMRERLLRLVTSLHGKLQKDNPGLLKPIGLLDPVTKITVHPQGLPRAYSCYPSVVAHEHAYKPHEFADWEHELDFFVFSPVGYDGSCFVPPDAEELTPDELSDQRAKEAGSSRMGSVFILPPRGVPVPEDFNPAIHRFSEAPPAPARKAFVAGGRAMELVAAYHRRASEWEKACQPAVQALWRIIQQAVLPAIFNRASRGGPNFSLVCGYAPAEEGKTEFFIVFKEEAGLDGSGSPPLSPPETELLLENPFFRVKARGDVLVVIPRRDTPEGMRLKQILDVPAAPRPDEFPELRIPVWPAGEGRDDSGFGIAEREGKTILVYPAPSVSGDSYSPPGVRPLSMPLYLWLGADQSDRNLGVVPPPLPVKLQEEFADFKKEAFEDVLRPFMAPPQPG